MEVYLNYSDAVNVLTVDQSRAGSNPLNRICVDIISLQQHFTVAPLGAGALLTVRISG